MTKAIWLAGAALCALLGGSAMAQTAPVANASAADAARQGLLVFEPVFFADARPDTALDMIARLPGFAFESGDSGTRGLAGTAGNVLIDGARPSTKSDSLDQILRRISAAGVARVELIRGGAPGIDMQGRSVVANVVLIRTVTTERVVEANTYVYPDGHLGPVLSARWSRRDGDDQAEGSISGFTDRTDGTGDGFRRRYDPAGNLIQDADLVLWDRIRNLRATGAVQRRIGGGLLRVNGLLGWFGNENAQDLLIRSGPGVDSFNDEEANDVNSELGVNWTRDLGPRTGLELTGLQRYSTEDYTGVSESSGDSSTFTADSTSGESIGRAIVRFRPDDRWSFETGGEVAYNFLDSATAYSENGVPIPLPSSAVKVEELRGEVFGQATWRPTPTLTIEGGLRVEVSEISQSGDSDLTKSFVYPKPRIQATWTPWTGHQFRVRAEREVGQLDFGDFLASADIDIGQVEGGNPDLLGRGRVRRHCEPCRDRGRGRRHPPDRRLRRRRQHRRRYGGLPAAAPDPADRPAGHPQRPLPDPWQLVLDGCARSGDRRGATLPGQPGLRLRRLLQPGSGRRALVLGLRARLQRRQGSQLPRPRGPRLLLRARGQRLRAMEAGAGPDGEDRPRQCQQPVQRL